MQFIYQHPDYCQRLILIGSGGLGPDVGWTLRLLSAPGAELILPMIAPPAGGVDRRVACGSWFGKSGVGSPRGAEMWSAYRSLADDGHPPGVSAHAVFGGRLPRPGRERTEPAARSGRLCLTMVDLPRPGHHHPVHHVDAARDTRPDVRLEVLPGVGPLPAGRMPDGGRRADRGLHRPAKPPRTSNSPLPRCDPLFSSVSPPRPSRWLATVTPEGPPTRRADRVRPRRARLLCTRRWTGKPKVLCAAATAGQHRGSIRGLPYLGGPLPSTTGHSCGGCWLTALATSVVSTGPSLRPGSGSCCGPSIPRHQ